MIKEFTGEYRFLSNFYEHAFRYDDILWPTAEHAYQASKTLDRQERLYIACSVSTPAKAKAEGRKLKLRPNWDRIKDQIMYDILINKFADYDLRLKLLDTWPNELEEGNNWGDMYWGKVNGFGENKLGRLLMLVREMYELGV